ncbi:MAG: 3-deoxy-D-manno-octulosonic acid transferase [Bacteroidetes bacterium]|nr:3-deoxy-D-manno-octulosonic acid transferase [Bacteroidota bacterium]
MWLLYYAGMQCYGLAIYFASFFNAKAKAWITGRKNLLDNIASQLKSGEERIWLHCSSLGEFEQGKPLIERLRAEYPHYKIVLTFFSPSGYNQKRNDPSVDYVFYIPLDGPAVSKKFIKLIKPRLAFFVKYEFWHFYIFYLKKYKVPSFAFSSNFRPSQIYFKWYGFFFKKILQRLTHIFVQNQDSLALLYKHNISNVTVSGDTRFDRVVANANQSNRLHAIEDFIQNKQTLVAGSTWPADMELLTRLINECNDDYKFIIAPHEIDESKLQLLEQKFTKTCVRYSRFDASMSNNQVLIIDNIGMLSALYRYATLVYVGGGFGNGIHNILEAVVFGKPVIIGPRYKHFSEANELVKLKGAFSISTYNDLKKIFDALKFDYDALQQISSINKKYIEDKKGATTIISNYLKLNGY